MPCAYYQCTTMIDFNAASSQFPSPLLFFLFLKLLEKPGTIVGLCFLLISPFSHRCVLPNDQMLIVSNLSDVSCENYLVIHLVLDFAHSASREC